MARPQGNVRANGRPLRIIRAVRRVQLGAGYIRQFKLACGHTVERLNHATTYVGDRMGCPHCK